jgi:hypothetical protein
MAAKAQECDMTLLIDDFVLISTNPKKKTAQQRCFHVDSRQQG